ncbi:MAG: NAD(P)H-hydrate epimerase, partial [Chloroflexi bacterium]|nr:NAD(P)H-hydrate epimerase [Chloroflexota bacterium]
MAESQRSNRETNTRPIPNHLKIITVAQMQALERTANEGGHSYAQMMERAGAAVAEAIRERFPAADETPVLVLAGPGNNGGDGLVCARHLHDAGYPVRLYIWQRRTEPEHDYQEHFGQLAARGVESVRADADGDFTALAEWLHRAAVVVDSLLGTGSNRPIEGSLAGLLDQVNEVRVQRQQEENSGRLTVVAVDCPSGMDCDTGSLDPHAVSADVTATFAYAKSGHFRFPAANFLGQLVVVDIGIAPALADNIHTFALAPKYVAPLLPARHRVSHKGSFGKAMAVVGSVNYPGAAYLSCAAIGRTGAGLVTGAVPQPVWVPVATALAEPTWLLLSHEMGVINEDAVATINEKIGGYQALLLGCGLSHETPTVDFVRSFLTRTRSGRSSVLPTTFPSRTAAEEEEGDTILHALPATPFGAIRRRSQLPAATPSLPPTVIDADGLNCLALIDNWPELLPHPAILTPHAGEMARLCGVDVDAVRSQPWRLAQEK